MIEEILLCLLKVDDFEIEGEMDKWLQTAAEKQFSLVCSLFTFSFVEFILKSELPFFGVKMVNK